MSDRNKAFELQERLQENGISDTSLLEYLVNNYFSGAEVLGAMESALVNFGLEDEDEEDEVDGSSWRESEDFFNEDEDDTDEELRKKYPANVEGSDEFYEAEDEDYNSGLLYGVDNNQ